MSQNCLSQAIKTKTRLKLSAALNRNFYVDHHSWFFFFQSSKKLAMVMMAALINWVEMCCRATGDTGTVVKLGQCQTLQPWLSLFLSENTFFHTLTPFLSSSTHSAFLSRPLSCALFLFCMPSSHLPALFSSIVLLGNDKKENCMLCCMITGIVTDPWEWMKSMSVTAVKGKEPIVAEAVLKLLLKATSWKITHCKALNDENCIPRNSFLIKLAMSDNEK